MNRCRSTFVRRRTRTEAASLPRLLRLSQAHQDLQTNRSWGRVDPSMCTLSRPITRWPLPSTTTDHSLRLVAAGRPTTIRVPTTLYSWHFSLSIGDLPSLGRRVGKPNLRSTNSLSNSSTGFSKVSLWTSIPSPCPLAFQNAETNFAIGCLPLIARNSRVMAGIWWACPISSSISATSTITLLIWNASDCAQIQPAHQP